MRLKKSEFYITRDEIERPSNGTHAAIWQVWYLGDDRVPTLLGMFARRGDAERRERVLRAAFDSAKPGTSIESIIKKFGLGLCLMSRGGATDN